MLLGQGLSLGRICHLGRYLQLLVTFGLGLIILNFSHTRYTLARGWVNIAYPATGILSVGAADCQLIFAICAVSPLNSVNAGLLLVCRLVEKHQQLAGCFQAYTGVLA